MRVALIASHRDPHSAGIVDAGLCHGACGLGHLFNTLFQTTGNSDFADAARAWFSRALEMRQPKDGLAPFPAWFPPPYDVFLRKDSHGFLVGAAGIGLALLAAIGPFPPAWDRLLLMAGPRNGYGGGRPQSAGWWSTRS